MQLRTHKVFANGWSVYVGDLEIARIARRVSHWQETYWSWSFFRPRNLRGEVLLELERRMRKHRTSAVRKAVDRLKCEIEGYQGRRTKNKVFIVEVDEE